MPQNLAIQDVRQLFAEPPGGSKRLTTEVRWFLPGTLPERIVTWFEGLGPGIEEPRRTDVYLRTGAPDLNVKQREGRLEVKCRTTGGDQSAFSPYVSGSVEQWKKWAVAVPAEMEHTISGADDGPRWTGVGKSRHRQSFAVGEDVRAVAPGADRDGGCDAELTRITVDGQLWWTLAIEAFGPSPRLADILNRAAHHIFSDYVPPELTPEHSCGYAAWLLHVEELIDDGPPPAVL